MGSAIVRGLCGSRDWNAAEIVAANPSLPKLNTLKADCPQVVTTNSNRSAAAGADVVVIAVKPWLVANVASEITAALRPDAIIVSVAAGIDLDTLRSLFCTEVPHPLARAIPDTAISAGRGMTFVCVAHCGERQRDIVRSIFDTMGRTDFIDEKLMGAATALSSCGIAYVYKFVQAYVQAGVELGLRPADALKATIATVEGAMAMLSQPGATVQGEIDRVTTPGGMTIKGINELDHAGFTSAVIRAIKRPLME